ncbi:MAG: hypothetical protein AAF611_03520 [Bacteroidota bacterium]
MKEKLFRKAFKKAEQQSGRTTKNGVAVHLEKIFMMELKINTSKATFSRYYEQYIEGNFEKEMSPSPELLDNLAMYLGFHNYEDFVTRFEQKDMPKQDSFIDFVKKNKWFIILILLTIVTFVIIFQLNRQRWMIWDGTHYIEVSFDLKKYDFGQFKLYSEDRIKNFKKIETDCQTEYIKPDGTPNVWYGKNQKKELEYFTSRGLHPETGKQLKPLSKHMFDKHVCPKDATTLNKQ